MTQDEYKKLKDKLAQANMILFYIKRAENRILFYSRLEHSYMLAGKDSTWIVEKIKKWIRKKLNLKDQFDAL